MVSLAVDDHGALGVLLVFAGLQESLPVVHDDVEGVDPPRVEQPGLIAHDGGGGPDAQGLAIHEPGGQQQAEDQGGGADPVNVFVG